METKYFSPFYFEDKFLSLKNEEDKFLFNRKNLVKILLKPKNSVIKKSPKKFSPIISTFKEFYNEVERRIPEINQLSFLNYTISGGFNRSIILGTEIKDVDIFIYSVSNDDQLMKTALSILEELKKIFKDDKPTFYYSSTKKNYVLEFELKSLGDQEQRFWSFQIILKKHDTIFDIPNFDLNICKTLYTKDDLYFHHSADSSFTFMMEELDDEKLNNHFRLYNNYWRIKKYFNYGLGFFYSKDLPDIKIIEAAFTKESYIKQKKKKDFIDHNLLVII